MTRPESVPQAIRGTLPPQAQACSAPLIGRLEQRIADLPASRSFARATGVGPTNSTAERALRHAVIRRRVGGGTDGRGGSRTVERMPSALATCRQQGGDVLGNLTRCFEAHLSGRDIPWLMAPE